MDANNDLESICELLFIEHNIILALPLATFGTLHQGKAILALEKYLDLDRFKICWGIWV